MSARVVPTYAYAILGESVDSSLDAVKEGAFGR
jgi:hypothetical protein